MKKILFFVMTVAVLQSCDKVKGPYGQDHAGITGDRKVLLVDFTGHQCVYCPRGARKAIELEDFYGSQLIGIAIHCGSFALTNTSGMYTYDFRTPEGNQLLQDILIPSFPN